MHKGADIMLPLCLVALWSSFLLYRIFLLLLPAFKLTMTASPAVNIICGLLSDGTVLLLFTALFLILSKLANKNRLTELAAQAFGLIVASLIVVTLAVHMRYVEHFGMNLRPFHAGALDTGEVWWVGLKMVLESWRSLFLLLAPIALVFVLRDLSRNWWKRIQETRGKIWWRLIGGCVVGAVVCNAGVIALRHHKNVHAELRYNALTALYYNIKEQQNIKSLPMPSIEKRLQVRRMLSGRRAFAEGDSYEGFPLWQTHVSSNESLPNDGLAKDVANIGKRFAEFIHAEAVKKGPWNVVVVLSESLRANEIQLFGSPDPLIQGLTPELTKLAEKGVTFTEVISGGLRTHYGQMTSQCSLYGAGDFGLLNQAPMTNTVCASDVFSEKGYGTHFFYGGDNHFDNQGDFYTYHKTAHIYGEQDFPKETPKGGWGYSDHALFDFTVAHLSAEIAPFYAVVLTLTNHIPQKMPSDVPPRLLRQDMPLRYQMLQYVDWSTGEFYKALEKQFPHTIFVFLADHGIFWNEAPSMNKPDFDLLRKVARIPFLIVAPGMPKEIRGKKIDTIASNVDLMPTLFSLLGWENRPQQFMGQNMFTREGPVFIDWQQTLLKIEKKEGKNCCEVRVMPPEMEMILGGLIRFNLLAPADEWRGG
jgi:phosphoglycerol transferase MdoB-like AlkP superfamily enzyme